MDNAGENKVLAEEVKQNGITVEFVAPNTPQQNGVVERAIATVTSRARAMFAHAGIPMEMKQKLWAECFCTSTKLSNVMSRDVAPHNGKSAHELFYMKVFGQIGYAANRIDIQSKLNDHASKIMFLGYADDHEGDCYRVYKFTTNQVLLCRDIRWTNKLFKEYTTIKDYDEITIEW